MPRFIATAASLTWAPSCRSRSRWRSATAVASTAIALVRSSSLTRLGPSRERISQASIMMIPRASHTPTSTHTAPTSAAIRVPGQLWITQCWPW